MPTSGIYLEAQYGRREAVARTLQNSINQLAISQQIAGLAREAATRSDRVDEAHGDQRLREQQWRAAHDAPPAADDCW